MSKVMRTHTGITEWNGDFWCDSCGKRVRGITTVNGMDFCAKCYQETFGETEKDRKITDLQSQLDEKDKEIKDLNECNQYLQIYRNQDKISFCIEKLKKVLNFVDGRTYLAQYIKEQIEELKKEMK